MKRMVNENLIAILKDLSSKGITADDIEKIVDNHLYHYVIQIENADDDYVGLVEFDSTVNYTSDLTAKQLYDELQNKQLVISDGSEHNNTDYGYILKVENNFTIQGMFSQGSNNCDLSATNIDCNITIESKKQIF